MPKARYEALPAHDELDENGDDGDDENENLDDQQLSYSVATLPNPSTSSSNQHGYAAGTQAQARRPQVSHRRTRSATILAKIDIANLDDKLKRWVNTLNRKFAKGKGKASRDLSKPYEILASAFGPVEPASTEKRIGPLKTLDHEAPISQDAVNSVVEQVKAAIRLGVHPRLNKAGSSGSYFAKSPDGKTRAIFKPKNEEPYGSLNPKWSKWLHRNLLSPFFGFGRACLVPNFSYLSEAGASLLSDRLELYIVPHTSLVSLSSPAFYYDWLDRRAYKHKKRPLPDKIGSFQLFLDGFKDASEFLRQNPWPGRAARDTLDLNGDSSRSRRKKRRNWSRKCRLLCGTAGVDDDESEDEDGQDEEGDGTDIEEASAKVSPPFHWTEEFMNDFRLELEKLVILDVLMRNTDRGLDNFMIKVCQGRCRSRRPSSAANLRKEATEDKISRNQQPRPQTALTVDNFDLAQGLPWTDRPHVHIAAIDNSLSFPIHHPNSWRSYCYGWLFLPSSLIGQPFSQSTRDHFLPLLTNPEWWSQTVFELRQLFSQDEDFSEKMFKRQISLLKGQAWNIVMSLRDSEAGPLELCRRNPCVIHDEEETVADDALTKDMLQAALEPRQSQYDTEDTDATPYRPSMARNLSMGGERPSTPQKHVRPDSNRHSSEFGFAKRPTSRPRGLSALNGVHMSPKPIPVAKHVDLSRATFGSATGVSMIEHMERIQKQEEDVARLLEDSLPNQEDGIPEEGFINGSLLGSTRGKSRSYRQGLSLDLERGPTTSRLRSGSIDETASRRPSFTEAIRTSSIDGTVPTKIVIVERIEEVDARPFFAKW